MTVAFLQHTNVVAIHTLACCSPAAKGYTAPLLKLCPVLRSSLLTQPKPAVWNPVMVPFRLHKYEHPISQGVRIFEVLLYNAPYPNEILATCDKWA